jgi:hypothetical protein
LSACIFDWLLFRQRSVNRDRILRGAGQRPFFSCLETKKGAESFSLLTSLPTTW